MKTERIDLGLTGYDELFISTEERLDAKKPKVEEIPLDKLIPFKEHPFKVVEDEEMERLKESIRESGVLIPALARPIEGGYELISGHRRMDACDSLGMTTMPVIIRQLTDEEAIIAMVDSNLQREHIPPSEKAFAYKMKMDALKKTPGRPSKNLSQLATNSDTAKEIGKQSGESRDQVFRYIRLTNLISEILEYVDDGRIALTPAVEISYLTEREQYTLLDSMECDEVTPSLSQAKRLRRFSEDHTLTDNDIMDIMSEIKGNQKEYVRVPADSLRKYFNRDTTVKQMEQTIVKAMEYYNRHLERQRNDHDAR